MLADGMFHPDLAEMIEVSVANYNTPGCYNGLQVQIELHSAQGRWELVVLALLLAARVSEPVAESTFIRLRDSGLLVYQRVLQADPADLERVNEILFTEYRALIDRSRKARAIYANARWLQDEHDGDMHNIYLVQMNRVSNSPPDDTTRKKRIIPRDVAVLRTLRQFDQIKNRAHWICRTMAEAGIWPGLSPLVRAYYDRHVRYALYRLGLIPEFTAVPATQSEAEKVVIALFGGDTTPLYRLGRYLCLPADPQLCRNKCLAYAQCRSRGFGK